MRRCIVGGDRLTLWQLARLSPLLLNVAPVFQSAGYSLCYTIMLQFLAGFTLGNVVGMYLAQNYDVPNIAKKIDAFKKDVEAKKKPPE